MKMFKKLKMLIWAMPLAIVLACMITIPEGPSFVSASFNATSLDTKDPTAKIDNNDRNVAYSLIIDHMNALKALYDLSDDTIAKMDQVFYQANVYIANTDMTVGELRSYIVSVEANITAAIGNASVVGSTSSFLFLANDSMVPSGSVGNQVTVTLSVINLGKEDVTDVVITPVISNDPKVWPFVISDSSDVRMIARIPKAADVETAGALKQDVSWVFTVASDAYTGDYPLQFKAQYYRNGNVEEATLTTYASITGRSSNGPLISTESEDSATSTPRIIVTGFSTDPEVVYAGDTFNLTITVQNTSSSTAVSNIQFDLTADVTGDDNKTTYAAFLPTSGSATIYVPNIAPGETADISIEMSAKSDLAQKPYVVEVKAAYEDNKHNPYTATTNVSVPVSQAARVDTGDAEVLPESIGVGETSNVCFGIYNMGKTTLYNVQVAFNDECVTGGNAFIGKIESGATGNVDVMVTGAMGNEGTVTATISYEDDAGNVTTFEKEVNLYIYEMEYDDTIYDDSFYYEEEESSGIPGFVIPVVIVVVIIAVIVVIVIICKKNKKKKLQRLLELENEDD